MAPSCWSNRSTRSRTARDCSDASRPLIDAFLLSFVVIFVAELGDKSQLMALAFATRYRAIDVLIGITAATLLVHLGSVVLGATVAAALPTDAISIAGGIAFLIFAAWTLRGDSLGRGRVVEGDADHRLHHPGRRDGVLPRRAGRQDHARDDHPGDAPGSGRDLARLDRRHGRGGRDRHRRRQGARDATPGARRPLRRRGGLRACSGCSCWPTGWGSPATDEHHRVSCAVSPSRTGRAGRSLRRACRR